MNQKTLNDLQHSLVNRLIFNKKSLLSFFLNDRDLFALENANIKLDFVEVTFNEKEFGVVEVEI